MNPIIEFALGIATIGLILILLGYLLRRGIDIEPKEHIKADVEYIETKGKKYKEGDVL